MKPPAHKLPHLLSILPKDGRAALVRPTGWPANSFYKIARTNLRFRPEGPDGALKVHGKAWGQLFWKGKPIVDRKITPRIRTGLKYLWVPVERKELPEETRQAIVAADEVASKALAQREAELKAKQVAKKARVEAEVQAVKELEAAVREEKEEVREAEKAGKKEKKAERKRA